MVIPIDELLDALEVFMMEAAHIIPSSDLKDADDRSALQDLVMDSQSLSQELYARGLL